MFTLSAFCGGLPLFFGTEPVLYLGSSINPKLKPLSSDADGAFQHFDRGTAHARNKLLACLCDLDLDVTRPAHFSSLKNAERVPRR